MIRLKSPEVAARIGIETVPVVEKRHADTLIGNAEVEYDANAYAEIRPRVAGFIQDILTDEGSVVKPAETLDRDRLGRGRLGQGRLSGCFAGGRSLPRPR